MSDQPDHENCPLAPVDLRLEDVHRQWHQAEEAYFEPDGFRVAIQTAIQTLRTVTFILQSNKRLFSHFDQWYEPWQEKLGSYPLMRWMIKARNKIEKQGDLEAHSLVRAEIIASYLNDGPNIEVPAELFQSSRQLLNSIPQNALGDHIRKDGVLRIQRRWVENTLPDYELLDAVAIAYGRIAELVHDAHKQLGLEAPTTQNAATRQKYNEGARGGRLPCMIGHADSRSLDIWLATGHRVNLEKVEPEIDYDDAKKTSERYDIKLEDVFGQTENAECLLENLFRTAQKMFLIDGHHKTIAFLLQGVKPVQIIQLHAEEHGEKYLLMRSLGHEVITSGADAIIVITEEWVAQADPAKPYQRAVDSPQRQEALSAILVSKSSEPVRLVAMIERTTSGALLGEVETMRGGAFYVFAPIYEAWGKEIPKEWDDMSRKAFDV